MSREHPTLPQFLNDTHRGSQNDLGSLILDVALACKEISKCVAEGRLSGMFGPVSVTNVHGEQQQQLDAFANDVFLRVNERSGRVAGMVSEELEQPYPISSDGASGRYLLLFDPLDGSSNIDVNLSVGSIFSILRTPPGAGAPVEAESFLQPGRQQVAAGYAIYGPSTVLVLTLGAGVHAFTLDPDLGEFVLTREGVTIPERTQEIAVNTSNRRFWDTPVQRYVDECFQGAAGPRKRDFNMRWIASLVADVHRILTRGGIFLYPRDSREFTREGRLRLLYEVNPVAFLIEQAGGLATSGQESVLDIRPTGLHQRVGFVFGSSEEVEWVSRIHRGLPRTTLHELNGPLYEMGGMFRAASKA